MAHIVKKEATTALVAIVTLVTLVRLGTPVTIQTRLMDVSGLAEGGLAEEEEVEEEEVRELSLMMSLADLWSSMMMAGFTADAHRIYA